jgi:hypothetical protein
MWVKKSQGERVGFWAIMPWFYRETETGLFSANKSREIDLSISRLLFAETSFTRLFL